MPETHEYAILVVDDDEPIVKNMRRVLKRKGFGKVITALNAEQGVKLLEDARNHFFLIMSDQRMPGMAGSEFLEKSMILSPESRRMLMTGYSNFDAIVDAVNKGQIHRYISKPWNNDDLLLIIRGELDIYKRLQERKRLFNITQHQNAKLFDTLAFNDGYITGEELKAAQEDFRENQTQQPTGLAMDKVLITKGFLQRKDLSKLFAKMAFVKIRLKDREFTKILLAHNIATKKEIDHALRKQVNYFENSGVSLCLKDILSESAILAPKLRDEIIAGYDSPATEKTLTGPSADFSSEEMKPRETCRQNF